MTKNYTDLRKRLKKGYWICFKCAEDNGAKSDGHPHTCSGNKCTLCGEMKICNAITDWHWDKALGINYIWD